MKVCPRCSELYPDDAERCPKDASLLRLVLDPLIGKTVGGRFRLIQRLGSGGMSSVYLARHVLIDRLMAIKTLRRDLARDPVQRDRFLREARAVNRINHDNIVEISDFGETEDGLVYLVMEYVPGDPLLELLSRGPLPVLRALDIVEQCASALGRAHQMGVIHRDLKPENIIVMQRRDRRDFVKLLDFGIAKILDAPSLTGSQQIFGTPGYIAPEYIQSTDIDGRSDLYSLGCILYELVTGALPFDYEYPGDLLVKHVTEPPVPPRERLPTVEPAVEAFILRCLVKDPNERFRDAFHFIAELGQVRERLGPVQSWGGMDEVHRERAPDLSATQHDGLMEGLAKVLEQERLASGAVAEPAGTAESPSNGARPPTDTVATGMERPDFEAAEPRIPDPPAIDGAIEPEVLEASVKPDESQAGQNHNRDGLVGAIRWRRRYDALESHLTAIGERPTEIQHAMAFAASTLGELEEAVASAQSYQEAVEALHERARDFRSTLGRALDQVAGKLSEERGAFETLATRRNTLRQQREAARVKIRRGAGTEGEADALLWELAAVEEQLRRAGQQCDELEGQLAELTNELETQNETFEHERLGLVQVLDAQMLRLEATANALRRPLEQAEAHVRVVWPSTPPDGAPAGEL
ncbi:MAG: protein kinase [Sandaracinaceae bacterium]